MLPIGILDGQTSIDGVEGLKSKNITSSINSFEDAKNLDRVNEKMPVRRKENDSTKNSNSIMAQVAQNSAQNSTPSTSKSSNTAPSNNTQNSAHTSKQPGSSNATNK